MTNMFSFNWNPMQAYLNLTEKILGSKRSRHDAQEVKIFIFYLLSKNRF